MTKRARSKPQSSAHSAGSPSAGAGAGASAASSAAASSARAHAHPHPPAPTPKRGPFDVLLDWLINAGIFAVVALCVAAAGTFVLWAWRRLDPPPEVQGTMLIIGGAAVLVGLLGSRGDRRRQW